ncbi:MAG: hypothetical protein JWM11_6737 [Planctomycetaceae bacterium]|nr:hypothetical protein [Planctomycetaceae bacterium]
MVLSRAQHALSGRFTPSSGVGPLFEDNPYLFRPNPHHSADGSSDIVTMIEARIPIPVFHGFLFGLRSTVVAFAGGSMRVRDTYCSSFKGAVTLTNAMSWRPSDRAGLFLGFMNR